MTAVHATLILSSPWMLGFLAVIVVPWLIARRAHPTTQEIGLATTAFVLAAARQQSSWRRSVHWLVPLLRSLLVAAVVIAAAGPRWQPIDEAARPAPHHRVAILDDSPAGHASAAFTAALESLAEAAGDVDERWRLDRVAPSDAAAGQLPDDTGFVAITDGAAPSSLLRHQLADWTIRGGHLLVLLGPANTPPNAPEFATWLGGLTGVQLRERRQTAGEPLRKPAASPAGSARLDGVSVRTHAVLDLQERSRGGHALTEPRVLLETEQSEPLLVIRGVGRGCVAISAVPWRVAAADLAPNEQPWTDLPAWPVFPSVVDDLLALMAATTGPPPAFADRHLDWLPRVNLARALLMLALGLAATEALAVLGTGQGRAEP